MAFDTVYMAPRVRVALNSIFQPQYARKFWDLVGKLRNGRFDLKGLRVEKLHTKRGKVYSARLNVEIRVIFSMFSRGEKRSLVIWDTNHHDDAYDRVERASVPFAFQDISAELESVAAWGAGSDRSLNDLAAEVNDSDTEDLTDGLLLFQVPHYVLSEPNKYTAFERNIDRYLRLTEEQEGLIDRHDKAYLIQGSAGTGKTTLALFHALNLYERNPDDDIFFFTYQEELACVCRCYKVNLVGDEGSEESADEGGLRVFSYLEFCRHYLRKNLDPGKISWQWIDRAASLQILDEIIRSKSRWSRSIQADDTYSYIYSILKGRLVPGTERFPVSIDDYKRIFKGYGSTPKNLEEIMEIFELYESRLSKTNKRDEADLIRYCYQNMKDSALLSNEKRGTWIVIDEIQDFTELEWKSILLFWENKCKAPKSPLSFPFLSGDRNQNISRSGFRWPDVDSYVEGILKTLHRPNAVEKVKLHNNFRNTVEIFNLGKFIRDHAPEMAGDIGTPPKFGGRKPRIVIGREDQFTQFLKEMNNRRQDLPAPLVALFEDENDLKSMKRKMPIDDGVFLMPMRQSKGMEFEDCILYRLFASISDISDDTGEDLIARLFDLWYMGVTRARKSLLLYLTPEDWSGVQKYFADHLDELLSLVDIVQSDPLESLREFQEQSEKYVPNYNVIFLERVKAQEAWQEFRGSDRSDLTDTEREQRREQALRLWRKCRDWSNLGKAYKELGQYVEAIPYLKLANHPQETAVCYEQIGELENAAQYYEEAHQLADAARCYESAERYDRAAELYEIQREWFKAGVNFAKSGDNKRAAICFEKAENWEEAANFYKLKAEWLKAAELYKKSKNFLAAAEMYLKIKDKLDAARCYMSAEQFPKAASLLESLNRWAEAAECHEKAGAYDKASTLYLKAGKLREVAACAEKVGDFSKAASAFERMKDWPKAGDAYLAIGNKVKAAECYEQAQEWLKALPLLAEQQEWHRLGRCCERLGDLANAVNYYLKVDAFNEAGYCYEKSEQWETAADYYLRENNVQAAAGMFAKIGRRLEAARMFLMCGQFNPAMDLARQILPDDPAAEGKSGDLRLDLAMWAEQSGRIDIAAAVFEHAGHLTLAASKYKLAVMPGRAAHCFEKERKFGLAAELYVQDSQFEKAGKCFSSLQQWQKAAQCFERAKQWQQAAEMYQRAGDDEGIRRCQGSSKWL